MLIITVFILDCFYWKKKKEKKIIQLKRDRASLFGLTSDPDLALVPCLGALLTCMNNESAWTQADRR